MRNKILAVISIALFSAFGFGCAHSALQTAEKPGVAVSVKPAKRTNRAVATHGRITLGGVCFCGDFSATNRNTCNNFVTNLVTNSTSEITLTGTCTEQGNDFSKCNGSYCSLFEGFAIVQ